MTTETKQIDNSGPAFPVDIACYDGDRSRLFGMTRRQWLAGMAMQGLMSQNPLPNSSEITALLSYEIADAMIAAEKGGQK